MQISVMIILMMGMAILGGVGSKTLEELGTDRKHALFFLVCLLALEGFTVRVNDDITVGAASVLAVSWLFGFSFVPEAKRKGRPVFLAISAAAGAALSLTGAQVQIVSIVCAVTTSVLTLVFGAHFGLASSGIVPTAYLTSAYIADAVTKGYGSLELGESCLSMQLICIAASIMTMIIKNAASRKFFKLSHKRTMQ